MRMIKASPTVGIHGPIMVASHFRDPFRVSNGTVNTDAQHLPCLLAVIFRPCSAR